MAIFTLPLAIILSTLHLSPVASQTNVGCDASCPPLGYESDTSHFCPGATVDDFAASRSYDICHPTTASSSALSFDLFKKEGYVTVIANYYTGCEAGRRESGVFAGLAQRIHDETDGKVNFVTSLKGGGSCSQWAEIYQSDALVMGLNNNVKPSTMPLTVTDNSYDLRDHFFTPPYPHPSYIILDQNLKATYKSVGPCCGFRSYYDCTDDIAMELNEILTKEIYAVYDEQQQTLAATTTSATDAMATESTTITVTTTTTTTTTVPETCQSTTYSDWSSCSLMCGTGGIQFRYRSHSVEPIETRPCSDGEMAQCAEQCVPEIGPSFKLQTIAYGFDSPRDLAFHPTPGIHLGEYAEGRSFHPSEGEELWVVNGNNHSISIVASLGTEFQTTFSRRDRGYYHYMNNITGIAFNTVKDSGRQVDQDTYNFFAVCNDNRNDYIGAKEPNYFMGPTLYDSDTQSSNKVGKKNTVNRIGEDCSDPADQCFFLHADMLHEAPSCIGIAHDPEVATAYGTVYWVFDSTGANPFDDEGGELVKFDFQQPHGPGSMDHSIASVRRYPEVKLHRGKHEHTHAGMVVHDEKRILFVSNPGHSEEGNDGFGSITAVHIDTGHYSRTAREEYPIFSNRLPSFEYSIYECVDQFVFADGLNHPTGMAVSNDGERLFVAERGGRILAYEVESGTILQTIDLSEMGYSAIAGLAVSPISGELFFVDMYANEVVKIDSSELSDGQCSYESNANTDYKVELESAQNVVETNCGTGFFSLFRDYSCEVDGTIPNGTLFEQVHTDSGYASDNPDVQSTAGMDESAALLANRTDCEPDSELNFDALLLGGYYCHICLPSNDGSSCDAGGNCANVQWDGFTCDNEYYVDVDESTDGLVLSSLFFDESYSHDTTIDLYRGVTYRFTVRTGDEHPVKVVISPSTSDETTLQLSSLKVDMPIGGVTSGPILVTLDDFSPDNLYLTSPLLKTITLAVKNGPEPFDEANDDSNLESNTPQSSGSVVSSTSFLIAAVISILHAVQT